MKFSEFQWTPRNEAIGIGSTDARRIAAGDWASLWDEKTGAVKPDDLTFKWKPRLGLETENLHAWWHAHTEKITLLNPPGHLPEKMAIVGAGSFDLPVFTSLDRWVEGDDCPLELKHTRADNHLPAAAEYYMAQLQWQLLVTGRDRLRFSIIRGNEEPVWGYVAADADYQKRLLNQAVAFWDMVENGDRPEDQAADPVLAAAAPKIPINGFRPYDLSQNNAWIDKAVDYVILKPKADEFKVVDKEIRALIPADASLVTGGGLTAKRDARGAYRFSIDA